MVTLAAEGNIVPSTFAFWKYLKKRLDTLLGDFVKPGPGQQSTGIKPHNFTTRRKGKS